MCHINGMLIEGKIGGGSGGGRTVLPSPLAREPNTVVKLTVYLKPRNQFRRLFLTLFLLFAW